MQKEAFFSRKPCVTPRDETEWVELVQNGNNITAGSSREAIVEAFETMRRKRLDFGKRLYGDGQAARRILENPAQSP